jgi:glucan 1,3-beta-glucosidase
MLSYPLLLCNISENSWSFLDCDDTFRNGGGPAPDGSAQCNMACTGNPGEICGGPNRLDVYQNTAIITTNWTPLGCYTDSISARTLSQRITSIPASATTIEACQAACYALGFSFAGVEYSQECCTFLHTPHYLLS